MVTSIPGHISGEDYADSVVSSPLSERNGKHPEASVPSCPRFRARSMSVPCLGRAGHLEHLELLRTEMDAAVHQHTERFVGRMHEVFAQHSASLSQPDASRLLEPDAWSKPRSPRVVHPSKHKPPPLSDFQGGFSNSLALPVTARLPVRQHFSTDVVSQRNPVNTWPMAVQEARTCTRTNGWSPTKVDKSRTPHSSKRHSNKTTPKFSARAVTAMNLAEEGRAERSQKMKEISSWMQKKRKRFSWSRVSRLHSQEDVGSVRLTLQHVVSHWSYELFNAAVIVLNAVVLAWETQQAAVQAKTYEEGVDLPIEFHFRVLMVIFCILFVSDLVLRMIAYGLEFFLSIEWKWNIFDVIIISSTVLETIVSVTDKSRNSSSIISDAAAPIVMMRTLRLLRVLRIARAVRFMIFFRELRILVSSLVGGLRQLLWSVLIMMLSVTIVGVFMTDGAVRYMIQHNVVSDESTTELRFYYGTLFDSMATLYWSVSGGEDWSRCVTPLGVLSIEYKVFFYGFVTFSLFAMLNVMNAVFVDYTMQRSKNDRHYVVDTEIQDRQHFMSTMQKLFDELDRNSSGQISLEELETHMREPKVVAYFNALSLDIKQVSTLFNLMDLDKSGTLDPEEFVFGCLNLKGNAKNLDMAILLYETRWLRNLLIQLGEHVDDIFASGNSSSPIAGSGSSMMRQTSPQRPSLLHRNGTHSSMSESAPSPDKGGHINVEKFGDGPAELS